MKKWFLVMFLALAVVAYAATATKTLTITVAPAPLVITTTSVPGAQVSVAYTATLQASGGVAPYTWTVSAGTLPPGLTLGSSGTISGIPTTVGTYAFDVTVQDASGTTSTVSASTRATAVK